MPFNSELLSKHTASSKNDDRAFAIAHVNIMNQYANKSGLHTRILMMASVIWCCVFNFSKAQACKNTCIFAVYYWPRYIQRLQTLFYSCRVFTFIFIFILFFLSTFLYLRFPQRLKTRPSHCRL